MSDSINNGLQSVIYHSVTGKVNDSFVGLKFDGNDMHIYFPECYSISKDVDVARNEILALLRTIAIAKSASKEHSRVYNTQSSDGGFALFSYLWMIKDYLENGFYTNREKVYAKNVNGKINWQKTVRGNAFLSDNNLFFPSIVVERKSNVDNILVEIHKLCVKKSIDYIGWLFNLKSDYIITPRFTNALKKFYLNTIKHELDQTFLDSKRLLLTHMKNVLDGLDEGTNNKEFVYGVDTYNYIFEKMVDSVFGNTEHISDFYPSSKWQLRKYNYAEKDGSKLRPDTIILQKDIAIIIDSKYYRFGYTGEMEDLPETTSIQKQITYGEFVLKNIRYPIITAYNAFLIPYDKTQGDYKSQYDIQYVGFAKSTWKDNRNDHELVHTFLIDLKYLVFNWNNSNHEEDVSRLVEMIIKAQREAEKRIIK